MPAPNFSGYVITKPIKPNCAVHIISCLICITSLVSFSTTFFVSTRNSWMEFALTLLFTVLHMGVFSFPSISYLMFQLVLGSWLHVHFYLKVECAYNMYIPRPQSIAIPQIIIILRVIIWRVKRYLRNAAKGVEDFSVKYIDSPRLVGNAWTSMRFNKCNN